jgi:hypothetical protein
MEMKGSRPIHLFLKTALALCIAAAIVVILEIAASFLFPPPDEFYIWPPGIERILTPRQDIMPGTSPRVWFRTNSYGLRSYEPSPDDDYRILVLGGSAAECLYLDQKATWPRLLIAGLHEQQPEIKVWVGNGGHSGQNSRDHIFHLQYLPIRILDPDAIVILMGVNDFLLRLRQDEDYNPHYLEEAGAANVQLDHAFLSVPPQYSLPPPPFFKRTGLWRVAKRVKKRFFSERPQDPEGKILLQWRKNRQEARELRDQLPEMKPALTEYVSNINQIIDLASIRGLRVVFLTQPALWKNDMTPEEQERLWMGGVGNFKVQGGQPYYTPGALAQGLNTYNELLKSICQWRGVECFDLAVKIPPSTDFFYDDCHYTVKGSQKVADEICRYLLEKPPWKIPD